MVIFCILLILRRDRANLILLGTFLAGIVKDYPSLEVHAIVRSASQVKAIQDAGAKSVYVANYSDPVFKKLVSNFEVVINAGDSFDPGLSAALLEGLRKRKDSPEDLGVSTLVHVSGCASFMDGSTLGRRNPNGKVWTVRKF